MSAYEDGYSSGESDWDDMPALLPPVRRDFADVEDSDVVDSDVVDSDFEDMPALLPLVRGDSDDVALDAAEVQFGSEDDSEDDLPDLVPDESDDEMPELIPWNRARL
jgi:hypothetical protein